MPASSTAAGCFAIVAPATLVVAAAPAPDPSVTSAWMLFSALAVLLGFLVLVLALITLTRRRRRDSPRSAEPADVVDPWEEAGRRATAFPDRRDE